MSVTKVKISLTISSDLVDLVDDLAERRQTSRSAIVEQWLRRAASGSVAQEIAEATAAYYGSLRASEREDDEALARGLSSAACGLSYDDEPPPRPTQASRRKSGGRR